MFAVMNTGWRGAKISAQSYQATEAAINAQRKAGIVSNLAGAKAAAMARSAHWAGVAGSTLASNRGQWVGNVMMSPGGYYWRRNAAGGMVRTSAASAQASAGAVLRRSTGGMAAGVGTLATAGALTGAGGILKGIVTLLGGPIGIGLTTLVLILPAIVSAIGRSRKAREENTNAIKAETADRRRKEAEEKANGGLTAEERIVLLTKVLEDLVKQMGRGDKGTTVVINIDGKPALKKLIKETISEETLSITGIKN